MLLSEIVADVVDVLRRPDLQNFITTRARQQIKLLHALDNFPRDKVEQTVAIQNPGALVRTTLPPFFRKFDSIRPIGYDGYPMTLPTDTVDMVGFQEVDPRKIMGFQGQKDTDFYFVAGDVLNIAMSVQAPKLMVSYYAYPDVRSLNAQTWITENFPELVVYRVLMVCHKMLGNAEQSNTQELLFEEAKSAFLSDSLSAGAN